MSKKMTGIELPKNNNVIHFKIKFDNQKYVDWKISKGLTKEPVHQIAVQPASILSSSKVNPKVIAMGAETSNLKILTQPFGTGKKFDTIDVMYDEKYKHDTPKKCGWCTLSFTHKPTVIPYNFQKHNIRMQGPKAQGDCYITKGCYCSFNCALAQINSENSFDKYKSVELLYSMYRSCMGKDVSETIQPSPPKDILIDYGGILTEDEYRELLGDKASYTIDYPQIVCVGSRISRVKIYEHTKN